MLCCVVLYATWVVLELADEGGHFRVSLRLTVAAGVHECLAELHVSGDAVVAHAAVDDHEADLAELTHNPQSECHAVGEV